MITVALAFEPAAKTILNQVVGNWSMKRLRKRSTINAIWAIIVLWWEARICPTITHYLFWKNLLIKSYYNLKLLGVQEGANFGLDESNVVYEKYPLVYASLDEYVIKRVPTPGS